MILSIVQLKTAEVWALALFVGDHVNHSGHLILSAHRSPVESLQVEFFYFRARCMFQATSADRRWSPRGSVNYVSPAPVSPVWLCFRKRRLWVGSRRFLNERASRVMGEWQNLQCYNYFFKLMNTVVHILHTSCEFQSFLRNTEIEILYIISICLRLLREILSFKHFFVLFLFTIVAHSSVYSLSKRPYEYNWITTTDESLGAMHQWSLGELFFQCVCFVPVFFFYFDLELVSLY